MNKFREWYIRNSNEITWFLIGILTIGGLESLVREQYGHAALSFAIAYLNYFMNKRWTLYPTSSVLAQAWTKRRLWKCDSKWVALTTTTGKVVLNGILLGSNWITKPSSNNSANYTILLVMRPKLQLGAGRRHITTFTQSTLVLSKVLVCVT